MIRLPAHRYVPGFSLERVSPGFNNIDPLRRWLRSAPWAAGAQQLWRKVPVIVKVGLERRSGQRGKTRRWLRSALWAAGAQHLWRKVPVIVKVGLEGRSGQRGKTRRWLRSAPWAAQCGGGQLWRKVPVSLRWMGRVA